MNDVVAVIELAARTYSSTTAVEYGVACRVPESTYIHACIMVTDTSHMHGARYYMLLHRRSGSVW